jgi:DNA ligase D-like protein (predicted polymerase)
MQNREYTHGRATHLERAASKDAYRVVRDALRSAAKVELGQITMRGREHLAAVRPCGDGLLVETLRYADEVRAADPLFSDINEDSVDADLLELATALTDRKTAPFKAEIFKDRYSMALREMIEAKRTNRKTPRVSTEGSPTAPSGNVIDLMAAMKQSLAKSGASGAKGKAAESAAGLVGATQMGAIEFHIWGSRKMSLEQPDRIVFDLDPDEGLPFGAVRGAASDLRNRLDDLGLPSAAMLSGGKGIHLIVPLRPKAEWAAVRLFSRTVAVILSDAQPDRFVATMSKAKRKGRNFIDWLRNERGATAIAPYSLRARPGAKVAVPATWEELAAVGSAGEFDIVSVRMRLEVPCPLQEANCRAVILDGKVLKRLEKHLTG